MRRVKLTILFCGLVWLCCGPTQLFGSQVVTSGYICCMDLSNSYNAAFFELSGSGFDVTGSFEDPGGGQHWGVGYCYTCQPGTSLGVWGSTGGQDFNGGTATIGSIPYSNVWWWNPFAWNLYSEFHITGPPLPLTGPGTFRGTFSFTGFLCGTFTDTDTSCIINLPSLTGNGIVTVDVIPSVDGNGQPALMVSKAGYTFTPEPASWLLFGSGALGLAAALQRKLML
ncbi:MAG TPA: PEP-CTERM sorting domain-containing protein [Terriglobales bacterium]